MQKVAQSIYKLVLLALLLLPIHNSWATPLTPEEKECIFREPLSFGASITAETAAILPGYHTLLSARALARGIFGLPRFGASPHRILLSSYAGKWPHQMGINISKMFTNSDKDLGSTQVQSLLTGEHQKNFAKASVLISMDAFYWDAISNTCSYGPNAGVEKQIADLIHSSYVQGKTLILGKAPKEDPKKVLIDSESLGIPGLWYNPDANCVASINSTLDRLCTTEKRCYLIKIDQMVETLNTGGKLLVNGKEHGLYSIRPDGVHLSVHGSEYLTQQIISALESNPPQCKHPNK